MGQFAYDIRGVYPEKVNEKTAYNAGRAIPLFLKAKEVLVGRDCRVSSPALAKSLIYGLTDQGVNVRHIGYCTTPMTYWASKKISTLMVTASHNPAQYNGIKITRKGVEPIGEHNGLDTIEKLMNKCHFPEPKRRGIVTQRNVLADYVRDARKLVNGKYSPLRVLVDCGNGMAGYVVPTLLKGTKIRHDLLFGNMDGRFPNHTPNPAIPENTLHLERAMRKGDYDLGIAYDGDCDRVYFVDERGNRTRPEFALLLMARHFAKKGDSLVYTVNCSRIAREAAAEMGLRAVPSPIGHTEIPLVMKKNNGAVGGEITGHFYFKKFNYADSGDIAALTVLSVLSQSGMKYSELVRQYERYSTSEELNFKVDDKQAVLKRVKDAHKGMKTSTLDGISIDADHYWFNMRISKTENYVRLNVEARNDAQLRKAIKKLSSLVQNRAND